MKIESQKGWIISRDGQQIVRVFSREKAEQVRDELNANIGDGHFIRPVWPGE